MKSLQTRLIAMSVAVMLGSGLAAGLGGYRAARIEADEVFDTQLAQFAQTLQFLVQAEEFSSMGDIGAGPPSGHSMLVYQIWRLKPPRPRVGSIAWSRTRLPGAAEPAYPRLVMRSSPIPWTLATAGNGYSQVELDGRRFRFFSMTSANGEYRIDVGENLIDREEMIRQIAWNNTWPYLLALPLGIGILIWWMHRGLAPLRQLATELRTREPDRLGPLALDHPPSELEPVQRAINALFERLSRAIENERRFTGDAAHELRTPMAALRAQLDALRLAKDKDSRIQAQQQAVTSLDRMVRLVNQLLTLARLDADRPPVPPAIDAMAVASEVCRDQAAGAVARDIDLSLHGDAVGMHCEEDDLRILLRNLIDNAIRYAAPGDRIEVHLDRGDGMTTLRVADSGPGITGARLREIGQRFHRLGATTLDGSGLGLSIVLRIAERYDAEVFFGRGLDGHGLSVAIRFPDPPGGKTGQSRSTT